MSTSFSLEACLRPEHPADVEPIRHVNISAFGTDAEADLVDSLRKAGAVTLSVVTVLGATGPDWAGLSTADQGRLYTGEVHGGEVVGHVLFTPVTVTTDNSEVPLLGLGPVSVLPANQCHGLGTMMISGSLEYLRTRGHRGVVVVGAPDFYRRFGFIQADRWGLRCELEVPAENFMALALTPGILGGMMGTVRYRPEFNQV
jgi:putative acetyltransferase